MHSVLLAASDLADTPTTFPGLFTLYTFLFALTVLYYLLLSPNARALAIGGPLQKLLKWALGEDQQFKIAGIGFALLSGKIYLNHIEYRTKNSCIRVLQSTVRINWWFSEVRDQDTKHDEKLPCRLSLELVGLEYIIYHNSYVYDHLAELIFGAAGMDLKSEMENAAGGKKGGGGGGVKKKEAASSLSRGMDGSSSSLLGGDGDGDGGKDGGFGPDGAPVAPPKVIVPVSLPGFYRFFPVTKVTIKSLNVMIGNLKLPTFLVVHCSSAQILHATSKPASPHAAYACITEVTHLLDAEIYLQRNPDYRSSADLKHIKQQLDEEDYFLIAIETFGRILKEKGPLHSEAKNPPRKGDRGTHRIMEPQSQPQQTGSQQQQQQQQQQTQPNASPQPPDGGASSPFGLSSRASNGNNASQAHAGGGGNGRGSVIVGGGGGGGSDEEIEMVNLRGRGSVIDKDAGGSQVDQGIGLGFDSDAQPRDVAEYILVDDMTQLGGGGSGGNATAGGANRRDASGRVRARGGANPAKRGGIGGGNDGISGGLNLDQMDDDDANFDDSASSAAKHRPAAAAAAAARAVKSDKEMILECHEMNLEYSFDVPQLLTARDVAWFKSHLLAVPNHAAKQRIRLEFCRTALIRYGPWTDHQRALLMSYFKPWDYQNQEVFVPEIGVAWPYTSLVIDAVWLTDESNIKLPYRDLYKLAPSLGLPGDVPLPESVNTAAQATQNVEITFGAESWLSYDMGWSAIDAKLGTCTNIKANFSHAIIWTHVPSASSLPGSDAHLCPIFQPLIECELLDISVSMHWPTLWNALYKWRYSLNFHTTKLWYTSNVLDWFGEFMADWGKYGELSSNIRKIGGTSLSYFVPTVWTYAIALNDYEVYLNVNENNVIDVEPYPTVVVGEENRRRNKANANAAAGTGATVAAAAAATPGGSGTPAASAQPAPAGSSSRRSKRESRSPPAPCSSAVRPPSGFGTINNLDTNTYVILRGPDLLVKLTTPWVDFHARASNMDYEVHIRNVRAHLSLPRSHPLLELIESSSNFQMLYINHLKLVANQVWHYRFNTEYRDSHRIHMSIEGAELDAFGHYMRYLLAFKENYFGNNTSWISSKEYAKYGWRNIQDWTRYVKYYEGPGTGSGGGANAGNNNAASPSPVPDLGSHADGQSAPRSVPLVSEDRNASELSFSITAENLSVNLPLHLYSNPSPSLQPKLRCYTLQVEMRSVQQYFDLLVSASPLTATIPIPLNSPLMQLIRVAEDDTDSSVGRNRSWNEKETYFHIKDIMFSLHMSKGDLPRLTVYRSLMKLHISAVLAQLFPQQLMTFATCASNFMEQWTEAADHTIHPAPPATDLTLPSSVQAESKSSSKWSETFSPRETPEQIQIKAELTAYLQDLQLYSRLADLGLEVAVRHLQFNLLHPPLPPNALTVSMASQAVHSINAERAKQWQQAHGNKGPLPSGPNNPVPQFPAVATSHLSLTRLILPQGLQVYSSSLITPQSHSKLVAEVPAIDLSYLICADLKGMRSGGGGGGGGGGGNGPPGPMFGGHTAASPEEFSDDISRWVSIFQLRLGVAVTKGLQRSDWLSAMRRQQDFIYSQMHQEGPMDDSEAYPWHEANANKVPYVLVDDAAMVSAGMDYHAQMQMMQAYDQNNQQQYLMQQQQQQLQSQHSHLAVHAHHHHPRLYRSRTTAAASSISQHPAQSSASVTIEDGEFEEKEEEYRARSAARNAAAGAQILYGIPSAADPLNSVAEEDESYRSRPNSRSTSSYQPARGSAPSLSKTPSEEAFANSDALPPMLGISREQSAPGSGTHYLSHVRQRSFQISRGTGRRATLGGGSLHSSPAMHQRSHSFLQAGGASMAHLRTLSNNLMSSRSEGQPNLISQPNSPLRPIRSLGDSDDDERTSVARMLEDQRNRSFLEQTVPAASASTTSHRREPSTTSRRSEGSTLADEDNDDFESCKSLPSGHSSDNSDTEERFEDFEQQEGVPNLAPPPFLSTATQQQQPTRSQAQSAGPISPKHVATSMFDSAAAAVSAATAAANAAAAQLGAMGSPRGHGRVRSFPLNINAASLRGNRLPQLSPTRGPIGSPRAAFHRALSPSPRKSQHAAGGGVLSPPQQPRLPNYVSPLPPPELQMYLEHYALNPASHAFVQGQAPGASRGAVSRSNPAHLSQLLNRATVFDSSLAGTSAGAFLSLPVVQFDQLNCNSDSSYGSTGGGFTDDTFTGSFEGTYATTSTSYSGGESAYYSSAPFQQMPSDRVGASPSAHLFSSSSATSPQPPAHWNASRRGSTDGTGVAPSAAYAAAAMAAEGVLPVPTPYHQAPGLSSPGLPSSRMHNTGAANKDRPFLVTPVMPAGVSSHSKDGGSHHGLNSSVSVGGASHSVGVTTMEIVHNRHTLFNTSKMVVEMTSDVTMLLCPSFIANLDQYLPFLQPGYTTLEDTLDELHMQFTRAFAQTIAPVVVAPPNNVQAPCNAGDAEVWHTSCAQVSFLMPRLYVELLQSSSGNSTEADWVPPSPRTRVTQAAHARNESGRFGASSAPAVPKPKPVIYATTLCIEGVSANIAQNFPLPQLFTNTLTGTSLLNAAPKPSSQGQLSLNKLHAYSCILNPQRYCGLQQENEDSDGWGSTDEYDANGGHTAPTGHVHSSACWGPDSIAIPQQELESLLPPAILSTSAVFVSAELHNTVLSFQQNTTTDLNPLYTKPSVALTMPAFSNGVVSPVAAHELTSPASASVGGGAHHRVKSAVTFIEKPGHGRAASSSSVMPNSPPATVRMLRRTPPGVPDSGVPVGSGESARSFSFIVEDGDREEVSPADELSPAQMQMPRQLSSHYLHPSSAVHGGVPPSPAALNAFVHSHASSVRVHLTNMAVLSGWDAPSRVVTATKDWITALNQLEIFAVAREWQGEAAVAASQAAAAEQQAAKESVAGSASASSPTGSPTHKNPGATAAANANASALALFSTLPGGPGTSLRRSRWQTLIAFALQHVVHSRALDENRGGSKSFGETDQLRLLQWMHHRCRMQMGLRPDAVAEGGFLGSEQAPLDEVGHMLQTYGVSTTGVYYPPGSRHDLMDYGVSAADLNFLQSGAAPLTLALRKLLKLPPSLMRRLNYKLQRSDEASFAHVATGASSSSGVGGSGVPLGFAFQPLSGNGASTSSAAELDFVKLYANEKLEASELARLALQVFALVAPQAAKVKSLARSSDLCPGLWQSVLLKDFHRSEVDSSDMNVEWQLNRVRVRVAHAPVETSAAGAAVAAVASVVNAIGGGAPVPSCNNCRDHAISINGLRGSFTLHDVHSFHRSAVASHPPTGSRTSAHPTPHPSSHQPSGSFSASAHAPFRPAQLVRTHATRALVDPGLASPTSGPHLQPQLSVTVSPPPGLSPNPAFNSNTTPGSAGLGWARDRDLLPLRSTGGNSTIQEGNESSHSSNSPAPSPQPQISPRSQMRAAVPLGFSMHAIHPHSSYVNSHLHALSSSTHWLRSCDSYALVHVSDVLIDIGPDIHRFLASLVAATFVFADIHQRNVASSNTAAARHVAKMKALGADLDADPVALFEQEQAAALAKSQASKHASRSHRDSSGLLVTTHAPVHLCDYMFQPFVTNNYFLSLDIDTVGARARVPGTAALHVVAQSLCVSINSFRPLDEAELESKHKSKAGGAAGLTSSRKNKMAGKERGGPVRRTPPQTTALPVRSLTAPRAGGSVIMTPEPLSRSMARSSSIAVDDEESKTGFAGLTSSSNPLTVTTSYTAGGSAPSLFDESRVDAATIKVATLDIRLMDQDVDDASLDELTAAAVSATASSAPSSNSQSGGVTPATGATNASSASTRPIGPSAASKSGRKGTVLFSMFLRAFALNIDQVLLKDAVALNKQFLATSFATSALAAAARASPQVAETRPPLAHQGSTDTLPVSKTGEAINPSQQQVPAHQRMHSASVPKEVARALSATAASAAAARASISEASGLSPTSSVAVSSASRQVGSHVQRLMMVVRSEQSVVTLPFHQLERMYVSDYIDPWKPVVAVFNASSAIDKAREEEEARFAATEAAAEQSQAEGYTSAAFAWMRGETGAPSGGHPHKKASDPASSKSPELGPLDAPLAYLSTSSSHLASYTHWSILTQLRGVSLVMLPLPSVMFTYHLDRMYVKLSSPRPQELHLLLSVGQEAEPADSATGATPVLNAGGFALVGDTSPSQHKLTLHSANVKQKKKPGSHDESGNGSGGITPSEKSASSYPLNPRAHPLEKPLPSARGAKPKYDTLRRSPHNPTPPVAVSSAVGPAGAAAYGTVSKMQFVLEFRLPTIRASLQIRQHDLRAIQLLRADSVRAAAVAAASAAVDSPTQARHIRVLSRPLPALPDSSDESSSDSNDGSSSNGSSDDSSSSDNGLDSSDSESDTDALLAGRPVRRRAPGPADRKRRHRPRLLNEIDGLIAVGGMTNHLDENVLQRLLHLQATLNTEVNQLLDKFSQYSKAAGLEEAAAAVPVTNMRRQTSRGSSVSVPAPVANTRRPLSIPSPPPHRASSSPSAASRRVGTHGKHLSTLDDLSLTQSTSGPPGHSQSASATDELLSPISAAFRHGAGGGASAVSRNAGYAHLIAQPLSMASHPANPQLQRSKSNQGKVASPNMISAAGAMVAAPANSSSAASSLWSRYSFNVNFVFENIHITAGLSAKKTAMPVSRITGGQWAQAQQHAVAALHGFNAPSLGSFSAASPRANAGQSSQRGSGGGVNSGTVASSAASALSPSGGIASLPVAERAAHFQPVIHISTGTFSLSMRYKPKAAIKPMRLLAAYEKQRAELRGDAYDPKADSKSSDRSNLRINVAATAAANKTGSASAPTDGIGRRQSIPPSSVASPAIASAPASLVSQSGYRLEEGSNVIIEMAFQGVGLKVTTLNSQIVTPFGLPASTIDLMSGPGASPAPVLLMPHPSRRTLVECRSDVRLRVGFKVSGTYTCADVLLERTLMKVSAIPITSASIYMLSSNYMKAFADFEVERARLVQEKEIRDPLIGLRALKANKVWSHLQSEFPAINATINAAASGTASPARQQQMVEGAEIGRNEGGARRHLPAHLDTSDPDLSGITGDALSPTSAAAALAVAAGQDNSNVDVGSGSMLPPPALANLPAPASTKYELHLCMQSTEMVMLFEKDGVGSAHQDSAHNAFDQSRSDATAAGSYAFNPLLYQLGYADPLSGLSGALSAMLPSAAPTTNGAALSALVIFLDEMDVSVDYAPPTPATYRAAMAAMLPASLYAAAAAGGSGSHHLSSYQSLFRPPVNSVTSDIRFTGMELGCLSDVCVDTNELDVLASSLRKYRVQPNAVKFATGVDPPTPRLDEEAMSPRDAVYTSKHPYRSFSLLPGARLDGSGGGASSANTRSGLVRHVYNRFVCASTVFHVRGALPLAIPPTATAPEEPAAHVAARGGASSGTHSRHRSAQWNQAPQPSPPGGSSASAFPGVTPSTLLPVSRENTWEIDTQCSGAELDIDPSLVNHLSNLTSLVDLMSNYGSSSSNNIEDSQSSSPRGSISDPIGLGAPVDRDAGSTLSSPTRLSRKRSSSARAHSRSIARDDRGSSVPRSHSSLHGASGSVPQRTRKGLLRRASMRRRSLPDSGHPSDSSGEEDFSDGDPSRSQAYYRAHSNESSASAAAAATVSPAHVADGAAPAAAPKDDLSVELKINIKHGRCCLHALPQLATDEKGIPIVPPPVSASASAPPSLLSEDVYADFILPSICCTLILSTIPKEEIVLLVDLSLPPITLNPSILVFVEEVQAEMARIDAVAAAAAAPAAPANDAASQQPAGNDEASRSRKLPVMPFRPTTAGISTPAGPSGRGTPVDMGGDHNDESTEQVAVSSEPGFLATFLSGCAAANRNITVNVRLKHTLVKLNCLPMYDGVFLQFGSKRSIDVCISIAQLDQQKLGLAVAVPYISCTANVPSVFLQLGMLPVSASTTSPGSSSSSGGSVTFLDVRCRHAKLQIMEAYNIRSDGAPCRTLLFHMDSVAPAMVAVNAMAVFASFYKVWLLQPTPTATDKDAPDSSKEHSTALVPAGSSAPAASTAVSAASSGSKYTASRASFYYFAIGKIEGEANMLDVVDVANRWNFSLSRLSTRVLDVGGCFPAGCYPLMITMRSGELVFTAEPELDGMEGTFACPRGLQLAFCRLPLQTVHNTSFDFFEPLYSSETDNGSDVSDADYFSDASADLGSDVSDDESLRRRRRRLNSRDPGPVSPSAPAPASIKPIHLEGRLGKRMVNMLELSISATSMNFNIAHGRVQLLKSESSPVVLSLLDHWEDRLDGVGFLEGDGDWSLKLYVDLGERLRIEASSRAMPYLLEMITSLIKFTQGEFSRVRIPSMHALRIANALARQRRAAVAAATASSTNAASQKAEPAAVAASPALSYKEQQRLDKKASRYNTLGTSDPYHLNAPAPSPRRPSITIFSGPPVPVVSTPSPMPAGKLALHGGILELRLSSAEELERDLVLVEFVDFNVSLARQLHYSDQQIKEQQLLLELRRKRVHLAAQQSAALMHAHGNFGGSRDSVLQLDGLPSITPSLTSPGFGGMSGFGGASQSNGANGAASGAASRSNAAASANPADVSHIRTEEELSVALALVDEETDPLKRLAARSSQTLPYRGGALQPFLPLDLHRTLLLDIGKHRKVAMQGADGQPVYVWQADLSQPSIAARVSRVGATGPGIYVSRLTQLSGRLLSSSYDDADAEIDHIFRVPGFVLEMETLDPLESDRLKSRFVAFWDKSITVGIDVRAYKFLQQMQEAFASKVRRAMEQVESQAKQAIEVQRIEREGRATLEEEEEALRREAASGSAPGSSAVVPFLSAADKMRTVRFNLDVPSNVSHLDGSTGAAGASASGPAGTRRALSVGPAPKTHQRSPSVRVKHGADAAGSSQLYGASSSASSSVSSASAASAPSAAPRVEKGFDPESYFELGNPQLHVLDSATGISVRKILDLWQSLGAGAGASATAAPAGPGAQHTRDTKKSGAKASQEEQIIPAATHQITQMLDAMLVACVGASKKIDAAFEG